MMSRCDDGPVQFTQQVPEDTVSLITGSVLKVTGLLFQVMQIYRDAIHAPHRGDLFHQILILVGVRSPQPIAHMHSRGLYSLFEETVEQRHRIGSAADLRYTMQSITFEVLQLLP